MHRKLQLHHHKHSGKLIHHRHTSYWALVLLLFVSGGSMMLLERAANADDMVVTATVPAPIPVGKPSILLPTSGSTVTEAGPVTLSGSCPVITPAIIVAIYRGPDLLGSTQCDSTGAFSLSVALQNGLQTLVARVVTITGQYGEMSDNYLITYSPPIVTEPSDPGVTPSVPGTAPGQNPGTYPPITQPPQSELAPPLIIYFEPPVLTYRPNFPTTLRASFSGGTAPYTVRISWGDGKSSNATITTSEPFSISHTYQDDDITQFSITVTDSDGRSVTRWYAATNIGPKAPPIHFSASTFFDTASEHIMTIPITLYLLLLAAILTLWRYERTHFRQRVGMPMHYHWQRKNHRHK